MCVEEDADTESMYLLQFMRKTAVEHNVFFCGTYLLKCYNRSIKYVSI